MPTRPSIPTHLHISLDPPLADPAPLGVRPRTAFRAPHRALSRASGCARPPLQHAHLEALAQRLAEVLGDLVHADAAHRADGERADERVRILRVFHKRVDGEDGEVGLALGVVDEVEVDELLQLDRRSLDAVDHVGEEHRDVLADRHRRDDLFDRLLLLVGLRVGQLLLELVDLACARGRARAWWMARSGSAPRRNGKHLGRGWPLLLGGSSRGWRRQRTCAGTARALGGVGREGRRAPFLVVWKYLESLPTVPPPKATAAKLGIFILSIVAEGRGGELSGHPVL
jgi:hypothetical protein